MTEGLRSAALLSSNLLDLAGLRKPARSRGQVVIGEILFPPKHLHGNQILKTRLLLGRILPEQRILPPEK
jgi:hypothetical protein